MTNDIESRTGEPREAESLPQDVVLAFAPLHKRAFGMALGTAFGALVFLATVSTVLRPGGETWPLGLLSQYFTGYTVSWPGAFVGFAWAWFVGFVAGWFAAFCRNFAVAVQLSLGRAKEELRATRDFLDHI
jgi:hypothetical protein